MSLSLNIADHCLKAGPIILAQNIHLTVKSGQIAHISGNNGSGKTTLLQEIATGSDDIQWNADIRNKIHMLGHDTGMAEQDTPYQHLKYYQSLLRSDQTLNQVLDHINLSHVHDVPIHYLSFGQRRRLALGRFLLQDRPVWILDEPLTGLDKEGKRWVLKLIKQRAKTNGIVILSSHEAFDLKVDHKLELTKAA